MTLTVCVGSSGSGKTTFLEDVHKSHKCTYIRQYHKLRPYIGVCKIPNFDPTKLPYWETYVNEGRDDTIQVGGTMAGKFTAGLSGGQRKLLLFELICQRTRDQSNLLIVLDEPFAGVTDDFVPFITSRLQELRERHNILLVTNDHVEALKQMADNIITVSAIDRSVVKINDREQVDREKAIIALSLGDKYAYASTNDDMRFFFDVEVMNAALLEIFTFATFCFSLFIATFWDSSEDSAALVLVAGGIICFFCVNPYLLSLVEWRNSMVEEAEALVHASKGLNRAMKVALTLSLVFTFSLVEYGVVNLAMSGALSEIKFWVAMLFDSSSLTLPLVCVGLYTSLPFQTAQVLGSLPFLLMIFLSTTFSPGAGIAALKELRYLWARFYFWCMVPSVQDDMEGCPSDEAVLPLLIMSAFIGVFTFLVIITIGKIRKGSKEKKKESKRANLLQDDEFQSLQAEMYDEKILRRLDRQQSTQHGSDMSQV